MCFIHGVRAWIFRSELWVMGLGGAGVGLGFFPVYFLPLQL